MKNNRTKMMMGAVAFAGAAALTVSTCFADGTDSTFATKYQANVTAEQALWAQVPTTSSDATIVALKASVQSIDGQVASLYAAEQALATTETSIPKVQPVSRGTLDGIDRQRNNLQMLARTEWSAASRNHNKPKDQAAFKLDIEKYNSFQKQLGNVEQKIVQISTELKAQNAKGVTSTKPYDDGLLALKVSVLDLQTSAMTYTKEIIALQASDAAAAASTSTSTTTSTPPATTTTGTTTGSTTTTTNTSTSTNS